MAAGLFWELDAYAVMGSETMLPMSASYNAISLLPCRVRSDSLTQDGLGTAAVWLAARQAVARRVADLL